MRQARCPAEAVTEGKTPLCGPETTSPVGSDFHLHPPPTHQNAVAIALGRSRGSPALSGSGIGRAGPTRAPAIRVRRNSWLHSRSFRPLPGIFF